jgi:hypothetical protein
MLKPCRHSSNLTGSSDLAESSSSPPVTSPGDLLRERRFSDLRDSLARSGNPSRVWSYYTRLLDFLGYENLPLEVHQQVLRQCTPSTALLRTSAARRIIVGNNPRNPHMHEGRFQTIIRTIRSFGMKPTLDDYNFILEQFAAVGYHVGAMHVYKELVSTGLTPRTRTFGLCLQAIAHRLTLPVGRDGRDLLVSQTHKMLAALMGDMQKYNILATSVNFDLTLRIMKETLDYNGFESLMKWAYGIDLANPDRPPLEYQGLTTVGSGLGVNEQLYPVLPAPQPFSTASLNTTIDMLGRFGDVSKLIQAFEVLTQPLPQANRHQFTSFDDDDDFGDADGFVAPKFTPPHASPNTTTYNTLLRHLCQGGHAHLARHYLIEVIRLDRQIDHDLRLAVTRTPLHQVLAPHFAINRGTLLSVFGESNRDKNVGLMRWLITKLPRIIKSKKLSLLYFHRVRRACLSRKLEMKQVSPTASSTVQVATVSSSSSSLPSPTRSPRSKNASVFDLDLDAPPESPSPPTPKYFDLDLHIRVLERDFEELTQFSRRATDVLGRTTQRVKERLGRRVWSARDIYLRTDNSRRKVSRGHWQRIVGFRSRVQDKVLPRIPPYYARDPVDRRSFSTDSAVRSLRISRVDPLLPHLRFGDR